MKPIAVVTSLAVENLDRSLRFFREGLGLETEGVQEGGIIAFELPGLSLYLIEESEFSRFTSKAGIETRLPGQGADVIVSVGVSSDAEVDEALAQAAEYGGSVRQPAAREEWGYTGYFRDPDGYLWEIVHGAEHV